MLILSLYRSTRVVRRWIAATLAFAALWSSARAQTIEGQPIAAQFGHYRVTDEGNGFSFSPQQCNVLGAGQNFAAFTTGVPVKVWDPRAGYTEVSTQVTAFVTGSYCAVSLGGLAYTHPASFYLTSGTGGLQEALNNSQVPAGITSTIILNSDWYELIAPRTAAAVISGVTGNTSFGLVDITTNPYTSYNWNGSQYVAVPTSGSGATFPSAGGVVFSTSATVSRPATSSDISSLIAGATVNPATVNDIIYAAGVNGAGIGGAQTAWSSSTAYPQCSAVSSGGNNYLAVAASSNIAPGSNSSVWWLVPNANTPTSGDCAFYIAASQVNGTSGAELVLPPGTTNTCIGFMEPTVASPGLPNVVIEGAGKSASVLKQTCSILASGNAVVQQPNSGVAYAYAAVDWESFTVNANFLASAAMNVYGAQQFKIKFIRLQNPADGSDHYIEFGHPAAANHTLAWTYEMDLEDIDTLDSHGPGSGANITASVAGGVPTFTVVNGGSSFNPTYTQLILSGTGSAADTPCTNRGTDTINVSGGVVTSITTTATGCSSPLYASLFGGNAVTYCFKFNDASDSKMIMGLTPSACNTGVYNSNITSLMSFTKTHVIGTMVGITEAGDNSYWATQMDSIYRYGFDFEGADNVDNLYGGKFQWASSLPGSSDYHFGTISNSPTNAPYAINIFGDACGNAASFAGYNHFLPASGSVESGGALPSFVHAYNSVSCDQTTSTANAANYTGQQFSLSNGALGSVFNFGLGNGAANSLNLTYLSNNGVYNWNFKNATVATSGANWSSPQLQLGGNYWNGSASMPSYVQLQTLFGSGSNPAETARFTMGGTPSGGAKHYAFDNPIELDGATSGSTLLSVSAAGGTLNLGSTNATVDSSGNLTVNSCVGCGGGSGGSGTVSAGTAYSPVYYSASGTVVSGTAPFTGLQYNSMSAAPVAATESQVQSIIGAGQPGGVATLDINGNIPLGQITNTVATLTSTAGQAFSGGISVPEINNVFWADGFSNLVYTGIGQTPVAWTSGTNNAACQEVSYSGSEYIKTTFATTAATTPGTNSAIWWPLTVASNPSPTQTQCAFDWAMAAGTARTSPVVLKFGGTGTYNGTYAINGPLTMPPTGQQVELIGESRGDNGNPVQILATAAMTTMVSKPDLTSSTSTPYNLHLAHLVLNGNNLALHGFDFDGTKVGLIEHVNVKGMVGTDWWVRLGDGTAGALGYDYQWVVNDVQLESSGTGPASWASVTTTISGGVPTFTLNSGGSYNNPTPVMHFWGTGISGTSGQPCTTMGTITLTMSTTAPYSVTAISSSGFSGCGGTTYTIIPDQPAAQYGFFLDFITDSSFTDLIDNGVGTVAGIITNHSGNSFLHAHPYGVPVGIQSFNQNMFVNTEIDSTFIHGAEPNAKDNWANTNFTYNMQYPGTKGFYTGSQATFNSSGSTCGGTAQPSGFALITTATGDVAHGTATAYPSGFHVEGTQCDDGSLVEALPTLNATGLGNGSTATTQATGDNSTKVATDAFVLANAGSVGSSAFSALTSGTNGAAAMVVGTGGSLVTSGSGTIAATSVPFSGVTGSPSTAQVPVQSLTTTGSSGAATLSGGTLNIPQYAGGAVSSVANSDSTLTVSPTTGSIVASLNLGHANTWTAAHIFSVAGAVSTPGVSITGAPYTGGTATTNFPQLYLNQGAAVTTLNTAGTEFGINAPSGYAGDYINLFTNGGTSRFRVDQYGGVTTASSLSAAGTVKATLAGAASTPALSISGAPYTGGTSTTNFPQLYLGEGATAVTTFSTAGEQFGINAPSGYVGNMINLFVNGSSTKFRVDYAGDVFNAGYHTTAANATASQAAFALSGSPYTAGTATTNFPLFYLNQGSATAVTTLSTAGTELGINAPSAFAGHLVDLFVNGGPSRFSVDYAGNVVAAGGLNAASFAASGTAINTYIGSGTASNTDLTGVLAASGGSVAYTFQRATAYSVHPICSGAAEGTTPVTYAVSYTGVTSVTFTFGASFTGNWDYTCIARN